MMSYIMKYSRDFKDFYKKCYKNYYRALSLIVILTIMFSIIEGIGGNVSAKVKAPDRIPVPESLKVGTDSRILGILQYEDFYLEVRRIISRVGVAYCLEDDKDYPAGEIFDVEGKSNEDIARVLAVGYPVKTAEELGVKNDDDAYLATQIVLWSIDEGYSVYDFKYENKEVLKAIRSIYEKSKMIDLGEVNSLFIEYYLNDSVQKVVVKF